MPKGTQKAKFKLTYEEAKKIIETMKQKFKDSVLFRMVINELLKLFLFIFYKRMGFYIVSMAANALMIMHW